MGYALMAEMALASVSATRAGREPPVCFLAHRRTNLLVRGMEDALTGPPAMPRANATTIPEGTSMELFAVRASRAGPARAATCSAQAVRPTHAATEAHATKQPGHALAPQDGRAQHAVWSAMEVRAPRVAIMAPACPMVRVSATAP
eukprot:TRINITY_DN20963_c0_g1_i1.p4 TRINITY_DN20963_c0_g1~~TRINITY_DN20963_c0_g1_i1.p4  ORF type:complete len:146 (-),score=7.55 TRINITY_DN20963_c0_g1_i1:410-847(-)